MAGFQVVTPVKMGQLAVTAALQDVYTCPANTRAMLKCLDICNTTAAALTVTVYLVPSAGAAGTGNMLVPGITLNGNQPYQWTGTQVLNAGDKIQAVASAVGITINASGGEAV